MNTSRLTISIVLCISVGTLFGCGGDDQKPEEGKEGGPCYGNGTCDQGLTCVENVCEALQEGQEGGPCYGNDTCDRGLTCSVSTNTCIVADSGTDTRDSGVDNRDSGRDNGSVSDSGRDSGTGTDAGTDSSTTTIDPCDGVDCSDHGDCVSNDDTAECECDTGYHAEDLECVEDSYGVVMGKIISAFDGSPIGNASIEYAGNTVTSNEQGFFSISDVVSETTVSLNIRAEGYASTVKNVTARSGLSTHVAVNMLGIAAETSFDVTSGGTLSGEGAMVNFKPNSIDATGVVSASLSVLDPEDEKELAAFPGEFVSDKNEAIESFGAVAIELKDSAGRNVNIKSGETADVSIPVPYGSPATIALWSLEKETGRWIEEGTLTGCDDGICDGAVSHLSWWNADQVMETTCANICVKTVDDEPAQGVAVQARGTDYNGISEGTTGTDGCCCLEVKRDATINVVAFHSAGIAGPSTIYTSSETLQCGSPDCEELDTPLVVSPPIFQATLTWGEQPYDLDTHFTGPCDAQDTSCTDRFHVYFGETGDLSLPPWAYLDTDDTDSYGPEITSLSKCTAGVYRYSIYNFSGSPGLETSQAIVFVLLPDGSTQSYTVPTTTPSDMVWVVGDLSCTGSTGVSTSSCDCTWTAVNQFAPDTDASYHP